jgi:predicted permease
MTTLRLARALLSVAAPLVPADSRRVWRDQWIADLAHYDRCLAREGRGSVARTSLTLRRAAGAVPHAYALRLLSWSPRMLTHDLTFAWRMFIRRPAFTAVAVLILALGIGANATIFSWVERILLTPLSGVADQGNLAVLQGTYGQRKNLSMSYPNFVDLRAARPDGFTDVMAFRIVSAALRTGGEPRRVFGELVTGNFFDVLGVRAALGRTLGDADAKTPGGDLVAVISDALWRRSFGADPAAVGRSVDVNGRPFTIVGVLPPDFHGSVAGLALDFFIPMTMQEVVLAGDRLTQRGNSWLDVYGRLAPHSNLERAQSGASLVAARLAKAYPDADEGRGIAVLPLTRSGASALLMPVMTTLMLVVGLVLMIACANLASLLLARASTRHREMAVRLAVGASRGRLVRQLLLESLLLALVGGAAGLLLAHWASGALAWFIPPSSFPIAFETGIDPRVVGFAALATLLTALLSGLLPALRASRADVTTMLKETAAASVGVRSRLRQALVIGQVALSTVLLVSAALFVRSLARASAIDVGYSARTGLFASLDLQAGGYDEARGTAFIQQAIARVSEVPGVRAASVAMSLPLSLSSGSDRSFSVDGYAAPSNEDLIAYYNRVGPHYFEAMGIDIVEGRPITERDTRDTPLVVVINETMARRYFNGRSPIGRTMRFGMGPATVVGVARDGKYLTLNESPLNYMYVPVLQSYWPALVMHVRTTADPSAVLPAVQRAVHGIDPGLPMFDVQTIEDHRQIAVFLPMLASTLLGLFGTLALVLSVVGLYGLVAFAVAQRRREIGVRVALGADRRTVTALIIRQGLWPAAAGAAAGLGLAAIAAHALRNQLIATSPFDPLSFIGTGVLLIAVAAGACAVPALRAARLSPLRAMRLD